MDSYAHDKDFHYLMDDHATLSSVTFPLEPDGSSNKIKDMIELMHI